MWITCENKDIARTPALRGKDNQDIYMANEIRIVTVHKNGSSNGVVIPPPFLKKLGAKRGDQLVMWVDPRGNVVMKKMSFESYHALHK